MADLAYTGVYPYEITDQAPPTLISQFDDGKELRRAKHTSFVRLFGVTFVLNATDTDGFRDFYRLKGLLTTFTMVSFDPREAAGATATVRFNNPPVVRWVAYNRFVIDAEFIEVL